MTQIEFYDKAMNASVKAEIPSSWDEMTAKQVCFVFKEFDRCSRGEISPLLMNIHVLYHFLGLKFRPDKSIYESDTACQNIYLLCENHLAFLFEKKDDTQFLNLSFKSVANPLPTVRVGTARSLLTGPATLCQDLTFGEFRHAAIALNAFFQSNDMADLDECIAFLYRRRSMRANRAGRNVKAFSDSAVAEAAKMSPWQKDLIMMWFASCLNFLQTQSLKLNGEDVDLALLFAGDGSDNGPAFTWNDLLVQLARDNTVGNLDRVDEEPLFSIIALMWANFKENKRYEKSHKSQKA